MKADFEKQIQDIFGTTDIEKLRQISEAAHNYDCMKKSSQRASMLPEERIPLLSPRLPGFWHCRIRGRKLPALPGNTRYPAKQSTARSGGPIISVMTRM